MKIVAFLSLIILVVATLTGCYDIISVSQPTALDARQPFRSQIKVHLRCTEDLADAHFVFAFLIPRSLEGSPQRVIYRCNIGSGTMRKLVGSRSSSPKKRTWAEYLTAQYQNGNNILDDMVWVIYTTEEKYSVKKGQGDILGTIFLSYNVGENNIKFRPSYVIANTANGFGLNNTIYHCGPVEVRNGLRSVLDYTKHTLFSATDSDRPNQIKIRLNANASPNVLKRSRTILINAIAITDSGKILTRMKKVNSNRMTPTGNNKWYFNMDLKEYFDLKQESINHVTFSFSDGEERTIDRDNSGKRFIFRL